MIVIIVSDKDRNHMIVQLFTLRQGNLPRVASATVTAGLMCPPDTSEPRSKPRIAPIHHLSVILRHPSTL